MQRGIRVTGLAGDRVRQRAVVKEADLCEAWRYARCGRKIGYLRGS